MNTSIEHPASPQSHKIPSLPSRPDLYSSVHKGLRALLCTTLLQVGETDPGDDVALGQMASQLTTLLSLCEQHLRDEDEFIEPLLASSGGRIQGGTGGEHREHLAAIEALRRSLASVESAGVERRAAPLARLYLNLSVFVAHNLEHMHREETDNNRVLWASCSDDELLAAERALVARIPPDRTRLFLAWMVVGMNHRERVALVDELRRGAPGELVADVLALSAARLPRGARDALLAAVGG